MRFSSYDKFGRSELQYKVSGRNKRLPENIDKVIFSLHDHPTPTKTVSGQLEETNRKKSIEKKHFRFYTRKGGT